MDTLPSRVPIVDGFRSTLAVSSFRLRARLGFSIPAFSPRPARHYPRFRIWRPSSGRQRDFNPPEQRAAQRTLWAPPTSHLRCFPPRFSGLSGSALIPRRQWDLLGYCQFSLSGSLRSSIPGGHHSLAIVWVALLPAGVLKPSALSKAVISGLITFTVGIIRYHGSSPAFAPTHQASCYHYTCKARYPARG
jgi:hypothetical protein